MNIAEKNIKPDYDLLITNIANYVVTPIEFSSQAMQTAKLCLMDSLGCAILALNYKECTKLLGPIVPGAKLKNGSRIPGTSYELDPVQAAFNITTMIRWLDFNDTWLAAEWGHPSDNLGAILALCDYLKKDFTLNDVLIYLIKAYEIQGCLALKNSFNSLGIDHVILVKLASSALSSWILTKDLNAVKKTISQVFLDGQSLRAYRHAPNAGSRKSWAAGDASARGVYLALLVAKGEMGYPSALSAPKWGFNACVLRGESLKLEQDLASYVIENILFKISYPAEFHAQTAVECAIKLHPLIKNKTIVKIQIETHKSALRIISKEGELHNSADRDHCLQYMVAVALIRGDLDANDYSDAKACNPEIDKLRAKMIVTENEQFSLDYLDPAMRSIANSIKIIFADGSETEKVIIEYPIGHKNRRKEGATLLFKKFKNNLLTQFTASKVEDICEIFKKDAQTITITEFMNLWRV